jgi:hypothetical protein
VFFPLLWRGRIEDELSPRLAVSRWNIQLTVVLTVLHLDTLVDLVGRWKLVTLLLIGSLKPDSTTSLSSLEDA